MSQALDVLVGVLTSVILIVALYKVVASEKGMAVLVKAMMLMALGLLAFVLLYPFPEDVDAHNLESGVKNAYTMIGCLVGVAVVYLVEKRYVQFETKAVWWAQILKIALGLALVLLVKSGLKTPLEALFAGHMAARAVRYFLIVLVAGIVWPLSFRWFSRLGKGKDE